MQRHRFQANKAMAADPDRLTLAVPIRYKICRHFESSGHCWFGDDCNFAHGADQIGTARGGEKAPTVQAPTVQAQPVGGPMYASPRHPTVQNRRMWK
jgi:hypothetical protein